MHPGGSVPMIRKKITAFLKLEAVGTPKSWWLATRW